MLLLVREAALVLAATGTASGESVDAGQGPHILFCACDMCVWELWVRADESRAERTHHIDTHTWQGRLQGSCLIRRRARSGCRRSAATVASCA